MSEYIYKQKSNLARQVVSECGITANLEQEQATTDLNNDTFVVLK